MKNYYSFLLFILSCTIQAQVGGTHIYNFLNVPTSARQAALGGKTLTILDDVNQANWNPATININMDNQLSVNYVNFLAGTNYGSVNFAHMVSKRFGTIYGGITYVDYGKLIGADEQGNETGTFHARDIALTVGYAYQIPWSSFYVGSNIKLINATIDNYTSFGVAADIGIIYNNDRKPYVFTAVLRNIGYQITAFDEQREKLPFQIEIGGSYQLEKIPLKWYVTADNLQQWKVAVPNPSNAQSTIDGTTTQEKISFVDNTFRHLIVGAEFFSEKKINLRLGYNFRRSKELRLSNVRTFAGFTAGFGIKFGKMKFNYAYTKYHPASNTNTFSLKFDLNDY